MSHKTVAVSIAGLLLGLSSPALAQSFTLNGTEVPADQVERIQAHCDALGASEMGSATDSGSETSTAAGSGEATTGTDVTASATPDAAGATDTTGASTGTNATTAAGTTGTTAGAGMVDFAALDLATVDVDTCRAGGFLEMSGMDAGSSTGTDAGSTSTTQTTTN